MAVDSGNYKEGHGECKVVMFHAGTYTCHLRDVAGGWRVLRNVSWSPTWALLFFVQEGLGTDKGLVVMTSLSRCSSLHAQKFLFTLKRLKYAG